MPVVAMLVMSVLGVAWAQPPEVREEPDRIVISNERLTLCLGKAERGAITSLTDRATGQEFVAAQAAPWLVSVAVSSPAAGGTGRGDLTYLSTGQAATTRFEVTRTGNGASVRVVCSDLAGQGVSVESTAAVARDDPFVRWRLAAEVPEGLVLEELIGPCVVVRSPLGPGGGDAVVLGHTKGGVYRQPEAWAPGTTIAAAQPGSMAAQFACIYGPTAGLYTAAYDGRGYPKRVAARRTAEGLQLDWGESCFASGRHATDYDLVMTTFGGAGDAPADWRDAADLYKAWAERQPWCARTFAQRNDLPEWLRQGAPMVRFTREWLAQPALIERWLQEYWQRYFRVQEAGGAGRQTRGPGAAPGLPLIVAYWGWEKVGSWVTPDYFPVFPSDEAFRSLVETNRAAGGHVFLWPSGYHYTLTYDQQADGSFAWDDRARFDRNVRPHAVLNRNGELYRFPAFWLKGGESTCLCPGDPWTVDWFDDIAEQLARRGAELVQVDQVVGGHFPPCYDPTHPHPPGPGRWMTDVFRRQLRSMRERCRAVEPQAVVCFEEPNEHFLQEVGFQDYRDWEVVGAQPRAEPASVFGYLYHEYVPVFQSNPRPNDLVMEAYCLVNGQTPHFVPSPTVGPGPLLLNGTFEEWTGDVPTGWDQVGGWQGAVWRGRCFRDEQERHGGRTSLRLENEATDDVVQVSQNVAVGKPFAIGRTYRLSAWLRTEALERPNNITLATLTTALEATGSWQIPFPTAGQDWTRGEATFTVPERSEFLRIMLHVEGPARVWVDDVLLEEVRPDGTAAEVQRPEVPPDHELMRQWVRLFSGEGRPYLLLGRMLHPPALQTATAVHGDLTLPAILHNAYRAADGSEAVILVNATDEKQRGRLDWRGRERTVRLEAWEARLVRE